MKKTGALLIILLLSLSITIADNETNNTTSQQPTSKIEEGFQCLEEKADDCSALTTQEVALTILATPDNIFDDCVAELQSRMSENNWGNVRDTALAILALKHAGKDTQVNEEWILTQEQTPTELIWFLQEDSNEQTECHIGYASNDYTITITENKKIDRNAGTCLIRAQSNFWLQVAPNCYDEEFTIECDKDFIANLLYKNQRSSTIYVLDGTESSPAFGSIKLSIKSKCFGTGSCDYEATAWATLALLQTGHNVEEYIPYVIAMSETNQAYLPESFIYMLTNYDDYASQLIANQKLGNYWEAKNSAYNRFYDTSLALISLGSSSAEQVTKSRDWLLFSQGSNGCWQNAIKETAIVLWALAGKSGKTSTGGGVTYCSEAGYSCIPAFDCPASEDVGDNYFCPSLSDTCCMTENLKTCSEYFGEKCSINEICTGNKRKATDTTECCTGECVERPTENECEKNFYTCMDECSEFQEPVSTYSCDGLDVCCRTKTTQPDEGWSLWIWILIIAIIIILIAIAYLKRDKLKLLLFRIKTKFKKDKGGRGPTSRGPPPGFPPRPGFPPIRRQPMPQRQQIQPHKDEAMSETFRKLKAMSE